MQTKLTSVDFNDLIAVHNHQAITTSVQVAEAFNKRHDNVLRKIDELLTQVPDSFHNLNFEEMETEIEIGFGNKRKTRAFNLTKNGFILLVMGFTGKAAMVVKVAYISAFDYMLTQLSGNPSTTVTQREGLRQAVHFLVGKRRLHFNDAYKLVHQRFGVEHIEDLPADKLPEAVAYVHTLALDTGLRGEVMDAPKLPEAQGVMLTEEEIATIAVLTQYAQRMNLFCEDLAPRLRAIQSPMAAEAYSWREMPRGWICKSRRALMRAFPHMQQTQHIDTVRVAFSKMS